MSTAENDHDELLSQYVGLLNAHGEYSKEVELFEKRYVGDKELSKLFKLVRVLRILLINSRIK